MKKMKTILLGACYLSAITILISGCNAPLSQTDEEENLLAEYFGEEISVKSPMPTKQINQIALSSTQHSYVKGSNKFAFGLLESLYASDEKTSMVFSPLSIYLDLAMVANGTDGKAREEILDAFGQDDISQLNSFCNTVMEGLPAVDLSSSVKLANAIISDKSYPIRKTFKKEMGDVFYGVVESLPFEKWDLVTDRINSWVSDCTEGLIPTILDEYQDETMAYLLNALYFKSDLVYPFDQKQTVQRSFHTPESAVSINFMSGQFEIPYESTDAFSSISLPLGKEKFCMTVFLPQGGYACNDVISKIKEGTGIRSSMESVIVSLPKFKTESSFECQSVLNQLGISTLFGPCDFEHMLENSLPMRISSVLHKATVSLDENGVEASAATVSGVMATSSNDNRPVYTFVADHPFVYLIQEKTSGVVLFSGVFTGK